MGMWVQLLKDKHHEVAGQPKLYHRGDWLEVGRNTAYLWISQGIAKAGDFTLAKEYVDLTAGIVIVGNQNTALLNNVKQDVPGIEIQGSDEPEMLFSENMIWSNAAKIKRETVIIGFKLLEKFQVCIPMYSYDTLAIHLADESNKDYIQSVIHDLRVPVYNTNLIFIRRCSETQELLDIWKEEKEKVKHDLLAFHLAYYKTKVLLNALPESWCK